LTPLPPTQVPQEKGDSAQTSTRRAFQLGAIYILGGLMSLAMAVPAALYLLIPPRVRRRSGWIDAGEVGQFEPNMPTEVNFQESRLDGWRAVTESKIAWVVKQGDGKIVAFAPQCTHLACAYHWEATENHFVCPCHGSVFAIDGKVLAGPAPRPLDQYMTEIENNRLKIGELKPVNKQV